MSMVSVVSYIYKLSRKFETMNSFVIKYLNAYLRSEDYSLFSTTTAAAAVGDALPVI